MIRFIIGNQHGPAREDRQTTRPFDGKTGRHSTSVEIGHFAIGAQADTVSIEILDFADDSFGTGTGSVVGKDQIAIRIEGHVVDGLQRCASRVEIKIDIRLTGVIRIPILIGIHQTKNEISIGIPHVENPIRSTGDKARSCQVFSHRGIIIKNGDLVEIVDVTVIIQIDRRIDSIIGLVDDVGDRTHFHRWQKSRPRNQWILSLSD